MSSLKTLTFARLTCFIAVIVILTAHSGIERRAALKDACVQTEENTDQDNQDTASAFFEQTLGTSPVLKTLPSPNFFVVLLVIFNEQQPKFTSVEVSDVITSCFKLFIERSISPQAP